MEEKKPKIICGCGTVIEVSTTKEKNIYTGVCKSCWQKYILENVTEEIEKKREKG